MHLTAALIATGFALILTLPVAGQDNNKSVVVQSQKQNAKPFGAVQDGNTTIVFAPAHSRNIDTARLRTWDNFADSHSGIARALAYKPSLINDPRYLKSHPDLNAFFQAHPDIKSAMSENPGNFAAIPPRPGEQARRLANIAVSELAKSIDGTTIAANYRVNVTQVRAMRSYTPFGSMIISLAIGGILSGCFSSTKEVDTVPAPASVVQVPPIVQVPRVVQVPPGVVQVPAPVIVAPASEASQTTTSTSWGNGAVEQKKTTRSVDGQVQNQTTTTWNNGQPSSETTTTTTTSPQAQSKIGENGTDSPHNHSGLQVTVFGSMEIALGEIAERKASMSEVRAYADQQRLSERKHAAR